MTETRTLNEAESKPCEIPSFFMSTVMKSLSELETCIWDNRIPQDKVRMQNIIIFIKSQMIDVDKSNRDIISVNGLKYKRVYE